MTELNSHFTLLVGEFFMLLNLHQLQRTDKYNKEFANIVLTKMTSNNPVLCIKLQIMLAPLLRARIVLVSCALSTNTPLCRETINAEMQELDRATGWRPTIDAYFKKIYLLYKTGAKTIDVNLFTELLKRAINLVETSVYYKDIISMSEFADLEPIIHDIKQSLIEPVDQGKINVITEKLEEVNSMILRCGNDELRPFQIDQYSAFDSMASGDSDLSRVHERQVFFYSRKLPGSGVDTSNMKTYINILTDLCRDVIARSPDDLAYDVASHFEDSPAITHQRVKATYEDLAHDAESNQMMTEIAHVQSQYNKLYKYVMNVDPTD
jgi:hypothetical protein